MTPFEFIQLDVDEIRRVFESGRGLDNISHVVKIKRPNDNETRPKIFKRSLIVLKESRNVMTMNGVIETSDLYITYRDHGLWLTIENETRVRMIKKYEWENNGWEEKSSWLN